jgi:hypothetical protein
MEAHFFDIDTLVKVEGNAWIVDKRNPKVPIMKISKSDLHLLENGIYKKQGNKIEFNGRTFWLPTDLYNQIKIKAKLFKTDLANLAISLQEFYNKSVVEELKFEFNLETLLTLKNTQPEIFIICSKQTKKNYQVIVEKLKEELLKSGMKVKSFYYISDTFYNIDDDTIRFKKLRLFLQHLVGFKTSGQSFSTEEITQYNKLYYYDEQIDTLQLEMEVNPMLNLLYSNTRNGIKDLIKENIKDFEPILIINKINDNIYNRLETTKVILELSSFIKKFEGYSITNKIKNKLF